jgi:hypothetical protein
VFPCEPSAVGRFRRTPQLGGDAEGVLGLSKGARSIPR